MKKNFITFILIFIVEFLFAQNNFFKQWDFRYGGVGQEIPFAIEKTSDGGILLGGSTESDSSGNISQASKGLTDYWLLKLNVNGQMEWEKRYGGNNHDYLFCLLETNDNCFLLGGMSYSDSTGDVSHYTHGNSDFWILKIDSIGNKIWDFRYGGNSGEELISMQQTSDLGYILGGRTASDSSQYVSQSNRGNGDYFLVKIDNTGNMQWNKRFGGSGYENLYSVKQTSDGGFILSGESDSDSTGDVSQHSRGSYDYWVVRTDSLGNKLWDKRFGGNMIDKSFSIESSNNGGFMVCGISGSDSTGDISQHTRGLTDFWVVKIDSLGEKIWDKRFGGTGDENGFGYIKKTADNNYLLSGTSYSPISGEKSETNLGSEQGWVVKIDQNGNKIWDKTIFTNDHDEICYAIEVESMCFVSLIWTRAGIGGYKSQANWNVAQNTYDFWTVKLCDTTSMTPVAESEFDFEPIINPNPVSSNFSISFKNQNFSEITLAIKSMLGNTIYFEKINTVEANFIKSYNMNNYASGLYFLEIITDKRRRVFKIVKQ